MKYRVLIDKKTGEVIDSRPMDEVNNGRPFSAHELKIFDVVDTEDIPEGTKPTEVMVAGKKAKSEKISAKFADDVDVKTAKKILERHGYTVTKETI